MIAYLKGTIFQKNAKSIILNTGNIGYKLYLSAETLSLLEPQQAVEFLVHSHIKEDIFDLYGFNSQKELDFFKNLISVSGIGPKSAMEILNEPITKLENAILIDDIDYLKSLPGIGPKTAKRLVLELKNKIEALPNRPAQYLTDIRGLEIEHAIQALINLGYNKKQIAAVLDRGPASLKKAEEIITYFLKNV